MLTFVQIFTLSIRTFNFLHMKRILRTVSVQSFTEIEDIKVSAQISLITTNETPEQVAKIEQLQKEIEEFIMNKLNVI